MPPIIRRILPATRILAPLTMLAGLLMLMTSPAGAVDLTSPGKTLADAPAEAITQAAGVQPAAQDPGTPTDSTPACATVGDETDPIKCLPIIRWATSMQMSDTVAFNISQPMRSVEVTTLEKTSFEGLLTGGNMVWMVAALIINAVTNYQVNAQMVKPLNDFAAAFGSSIIDSGAIYLILGLAVVAMATAGVRAGFTVRRFAMMILSLGIFAAMVMGSMNDRGEGASYDPGFFSPAWMVQEVSGGFSAIADALATPISNRSADATTVFSDEAKNDPTSCKSYIDTLHDQYNQYYEDTGQPAPAALDVMSRWWEETAYRAFATVQYGDASDLGADYAACQQLETNAGVTNHDRHEILTAAYSSGDEDYSAVVPVAGSPMITGGHTNDNRAARQNLAWGLCQVDTEGNYTLRSDLPEEGIAGGKIGGPLTQDACTAMFTGDGVNHDPRFVFSLPFSDKVSPDSTVAELDDIQFAVVGDKSLLSDPDNELASHPQAYGFVANSAGTIRTASTLLTISYLVSALCGGVAMALLAGVLFVMKLLSYAMAFFLILAALAGVVSQGFGSASSFFKGWIGYTAITSMTTLLFAFVLLMASGLLRAGDSIFGQWALAMMIWIGLCPALSILMLNWAFKKLFRTSSPFTLRGMQAMAGNPAAVAGATAAGGSLLRNGLDKSRRQLTSSLVDAGKNRLGGGKAGADSKSPAAAEELVGDAENPAPADKQVTAGSKDAVDSATKQAVTSGTGEAQDGPSQVEGDDQADGASEADAAGEATTVEGGGLTGAGPEFED
ncbi:MAG: type IV secretion system protein, partial [Brachybacterium sp.]|nr:type IV secretion system protein [Brachybacterium sp.]